MYRKGWDLVVRAYREVFGASDDVLLVVKDSPFYNRESVEGQIPEGGAPIFYLREDLGDRELASLYRAVDVGLFPHRGEGFGLMVAELMACGRPVVVTDWSGTREFCDEGNSYLLGYREVELGGCEFEGHAVRVPPRVAEPDFGELCDLMRTIYERGRCSELVARGASARRSVERYSWDAMVLGVERVVRSLEPLPVWVREADRQGSQGRLDLAYRMVRDRPYWERVGFGYEFLQAWLRTGIVQCLEAAAEFDSDFAPVQHQLGLHAVSRGDLEGGCDYFRRAIELDSHAVPSYRELARCLGRLGRAEESVLVLRRGLAVSAQDGGLWSVLDELVSCGQVSDEVRSGLRVEFGLGLGSLGVTVTLGCILRDELAHLRTALESLAGFGDELVVVQTGPVESGEVRSLVEGWRNGRGELGYGRYLHRPDWWDNSLGSINDFAAARNVYLKEARSDFVLWFDVDEVWPSALLDWVRQAVLRSDVDGASIPVICPQLDGEGRRHETLTRHVKLVRNRRVGEDGTEYDSPRTAAAALGCSIEEAVARTRCRYEFRERIHEQIVVSMMEAGARVINIEVPIQHTGYLSEGSVMEGKYHRNLRICQEMAARDPESDWWRFNEMTTLLLMGRLEEARTSGEAGYPYLHYDQAHAGKYLSTLASICMALGDWESGLRYCQEGIDRGLNPTEAWFNAGVCYQQLGQLDQAERCWLEAVREGSSGRMVFTADLGAGNFKPYVNLSHLALQRGDLGLAKEYALRAARWGPTDPPLRAHLRLLYSQLGRRGLVREQERWVLQDQPFRWLVWRGQCAYEDGCLGVAQHCFRQVLQQGPDPDALNGLALVLRRLGQGDPADLWRTALRVAPGHGVARENFLTYLEERGSLAEFWLVLQDYHAQGWRLAAPYRWLGRFLARHGLWRLALRAFWGSLVLDPRDALSWRGLADSYERLGLWDEAYYAAWQASLHAGDDPMVRAELDRLERLVYSGQLISGLEGSEVG